MILPSQNIGGQNPSEFELISRLAELCDDVDTSASGSILTGIGDDAAVVSTTTGEILLTTDAMVDGVHFRSDDKRWQDIGWKCAVSNLSDIAAMGGIPDHALVTLGVPVAVAADSYEELYVGMNHAFDKFGGKIVGGDVVSSPVMFINLALTGHPSAGPNGKPSWMTRDAANIGDLVCVTGPLGGSSGGLETLLSKKDNQGKEILINRHFHPTPRIKLGQKLIKLGVKCGMDISDGLVDDLKKLARSSGTSILIDMPAIPVESELLPIFGTESIEHALNGGEDYELLFTAPSVIVKDIQLKIPSEISVIGRVVADNIQDGKVTVHDANGYEYEPQRKGWDHLNG
tara:strand:- start:596 stop:1627 length:1032 start_codon:yes stop_codon:yes gene_type:complete